MRSGGEPERGVALSHNTAVRNARASLKAFICGRAGGCFVISLLDKEWRPDLTVEQAVALADKCIAEARRCL